MTDLFSMPEINISLLLYSIAVTLFMLFGAVADRRRARPFMKYFTCLLSAHIIMLLGEVGIWVFDGVPTMAGMLKLSCVLSFGVGVVVIALYAYSLLAYFMEKDTVSLLPAHFISVLCGLFFVFVILSAWNGMIFTVDEQGVFKDGPYAFTVYIFDVSMLLIEIGIIVYHYRLLSVWGRIMQLSYCILPLFTMFLVDIWYPTPLYMVTTLALIMIFMFFHEELTKHLAETERQLLESRVATMVSQIQPHFLYNSLNSIYYLCDKDANLAKKAINDFSEYLQHILGAVSRTTPVPFDEELKYVKVYLELEKMRFGEELNVVYDIKATGFLVPALSVQPLVENAVKHGICRGEGGGTLTIATRESAERYEIIISDDGVGFDCIHEMQKGNNHIGIKNVKYRLENMCEGKLMIESRPGNGTIATIRLPKGGRNR